ncbi:integrase domain-containing protein (plasmid) [Zobellella denitrificans]
MSQKRNRAARNFGLKSRCMISAGRNALREGMQSHASIGTMTDRWRVFCSYVKKTHGISDMRRIEKSHLKQYSEHLKARCNLTEKTGKMRPMSPVTAQNYISAVNRVLEIARGDKVIRIDAVGEAKMTKRTGICSQSKTVSEQVHQRVTQTVEQRIGAMMDLQRTLGLRFEESAKINAGKALAQAEKSGEVVIKDGTKGGRARTVPITSSEQVAALRAAAAIQGSHRSMIPAGQSYANFRAEAYKQIENTGSTYHGQRHHYAQQRYQAIVGAPCPVVAGVPHREQHQHLSRALGVSVEAARKIDHAARLQVSQELGHGRIVITNAYLG